MSGALLAFCLLAVAIRVLAKSLTVFEILSVRSGTGLLVMLALLAVRPAFRPAIKTLRPGLNLFRNCIHLAAQTLWAKSLLLLPLATVFALEFTAAGLGPADRRAGTGRAADDEPDRRRRAGPDRRTRDPAARNGDIPTRSVTRAGGRVRLRRDLDHDQELTRTDSTFGIIFWMNVIQFPLTMLISDPLFIARVSLEQIPAFLAVGVTGLVSHYCLANAFRAADASVVVPLDFLRIPLIALIGWWLYNERIDVFVFIGAGLIIAGVLWNLRSEARRANLPESTSGK